MTFIKQKATNMLADTYRATGLLTIRDFIMVIIHTPLHHSGPCLTVLCCAPLIRHG